MKMRKNHGSGFFSFDYRMGLDLTFCSIFFFIFSSLIAATLWDLTESDTNTKFCRRQKQGKNPRKLVYPVIQLGHYERNTTEHISKCAYTRNGLKNHRRAKIKRGKRIAFYLSPLIFFLLLLFFQYGHPCNFICTYLFFIIGRRCVCV